MIVRHILMLPFVFIKAHRLGAGIHQGHDCWDYGCGWLNWAASVCSDVVQVIEEEILVIWGCNTLWGCVLLDYLGLVTERNSFRFRTTSGLVNDNFLYFFLFWVNPLQKCRYLHWKTASKFREQNLTLFSLQFYFLKIL